MTFPQNIQKAIEHDNLCRKGDRVLVAVSGGPDSMTLLSVLYELKNLLGLRLAIAHLNHGLRKNSARDQIFVKNAAHNLELPFFTKTINALKEKRGDSPEEKAREARLKFLTQAAKKFKANAIALGHTQDDLAETTLMRVIRGTGLEGLQGILPKRKLYGVAFIRPLLHTSRKSIENYLKKEKIIFRIDETNKTRRYFRNKIRHDALPNLKKYNPQIKKALANLAYISGEDYRFLEARANAMFKKLAKQGCIQNKKAMLPLAFFKKTSPSLRRILVRSVLEHLRGNKRRLEFAHIEKVEDLVHRKPSGAMIELPDILVEKKSSFLFFKRKKTLILKRNTL